MLPTRLDKRSIHYRQFSGGYAQALDSELLAILEGYRLGHFRRNEIRVFAGRLEFSALHRESKVSLYRIINCQSQQKGNRRLSEEEIQTAVEKLDQFLPVLMNDIEANQQPRRKPVARKVLRYIARGSATTVEALFCFTYFLRRIPQRKPLQRLKENEYYARFTYADFQAWTGVHRATTSRILLRLVNRGYLNTAPVAKQNENCYGQLFIDGSMLSVVRPRQSVRRTKKTLPSHSTIAAACEKKSIPLRDFINSPYKKRSTLINVNLKTEIREGKRLGLSLKESYLGRHADPELQRIALRAAQMMESVQHQAA